MTAATPDATKESPTSTKAKLTDKTEFHQELHEHIAKQTKQIQKNTRWLKAVKRGRDSGKYDPEKIETLTNEVKALRKKYSPLLEHHETQHRKKLRGLVNKLNKLKNWCDSEQVELQIIDHTKLMTAKQRRHRKEDFKAKLDQFMELYDNCHFDKRSLDDSQKRKLERVMDWITEHRRLTSMTPRDRQLEGIARAKQLGAYKGRPKMTPSLKLKIQRRLKAGIKKTEIAKELNVSRMTIHRVATKYQPRQKP